MCERCCPQELLKMTRSASFAAQNAAILVVHHSLVGGRGSLESKGHHSKLDQSLWGDKTVFS